VNLPLNKFGRATAVAPEPPFGETAANQLRMFEYEAEQSRASLDRAKRERTVHSESHAMTLSR